ncbi:MULTISPECIES: LysM domain-containing protein [unclassified Microbacterium]|uniref:LysM peptidoglycan-binding domain-containing protein n=1 Tax=unclassified Microbacterium TaxID=2609290 RepID=UPI001DFFF1B8|nr:LysM domain-containing protein [Microbacterium sp. Bi121]CAH0169834.1 Muramidase-2 [Microbacterium sp. Bi121]
MSNRRRYTQIGVPAAMLGVLAGPLAVAPAQAAAPAESAPASLQARAGVVLHVEKTVRPVATAARPASYTVQSGDTIAGIAQRFGLATPDVLKWNGLGWRTVIYPGQKVVLTAPVAATAAAPAAKPAAPAPAAQAAASHEVVAGDTIFAIAQKHGTSVDAVLAANGLSRDSIIYPGQTLRVAAKAASAPKPAAAAAPASVPTPSVASTSAELNGLQAENVRLIIRIGRELGVSDRGIAIALGTSMVEAWLRNLEWGDRDSLGLFQQRPSTGWGEPDQIMNRDHSIRAFFLGTSNADGTTTRGLLDIPGWEKMSFADAAQAVQISAYPDRYAKWEDAAYTWLALYG